MPVGGPKPSRRAVLAGLALATAGAIGPRPARAQGRARVVVVGGGFGGATCARELHRAGLAVTLVEQSPTYVACPWSNAVIAGLRPMEAQSFGYDALKAEGVTLAAQAATGVDPAARRVTLADGSALPFDRLVLAPGIDLRSTRSPATTRPPPGSCRTPGRRESRPRSCAASSKPWRTAASS
jgi:NADPH-dependent 2,4-dienoyl-CoA reductase/sulfur reductase-like enzyme